MEKVRVSASKRGFDGGVDFHVYTSTHVGIPIALSPRDLGMTPLPTFDLTNASAQEMMDSLWGIGFRPSEGSGSAGALAATQRHLDDMRKLAFAHVDADGPTTVSIKVDEPVWRE